MSDPGHSVGEVDEQVAEKEKPIGGEPKQAIRTAVVIVHGMGEQEPLQTLNNFVRTALPKVGGARIYFSRPEKVTDSYEARRYLAFRQSAKDRRSPDGPCEDTSDDLIYGQTEFIEYHWSYKMKGNKPSDFLPTLVRLLVRKASTVPYGLKRIWWVIWVLLLAIAVAIGLVAGNVDDWSVAGVVLALGAGSLVAWVAAKAVALASSVLTKSFVDVVRYLDRSPRSYEVRREIRKGMIDLLDSLHKKGRYSRVIVVAHSLGGYIAYDAISALWPQMNKLHAGPLHKGRPVQPLAGLEELENQARAVAEHPDEGLSEEQETQLEEFRDAQFELWKGLRKQGNPWLITDFITLGTPMYFADLLYTSNRTEFMQLVKTSELPRCPPVNGNQTAEGELRPPGSYGWGNQGRTVLSHGCPFAVVRWTNMYFPAENSWSGDWFGGALRPLFGKGILDRPVVGNLPDRRTPGLAHAKYLVLPEQTDEGDVAPVLQQVMRLNIDSELEVSCKAPGYLEASGVTY